MSRLELVLACCCLTAAARAAERPTDNSVEPPAAKPNVVYILADDLGYGDLSCYGQRKLATPNIDGLALEGLRFTSHYSGNTVCSPSRAALMTGRHPGHCYLRNNVHDERDAALPPAATVLPELFKAAGYTTGAFGKWGLGVTSRGGVESPLSHGFDTFYGWKSQLIAHTYFPTSVVDDGREIPLAPGTFVHDLIIERMLEFIRQSAEAQQPFFCYIPTAVPHAAMHAPSSLHAKWRRVFPQFDEVIGEYSAGPDEPCPPVRNPIAGFAAMLENLDNQVGQLVALLEELGIDDKTLVMFSSDNGAHHEGGHDPQFWNSTGGLRGHKRDMHEGGIRAPLLARWPGVVPAGQTTAHVSAFWDIVPTVAELVGQPVPAGCDGISLLPTLRGEADRQATHEFLYWEYRRAGDQALFSQAVRMGKWKAYREHGKALELFDLEADPFESRDLSQQRLDVVRRIDEILKTASTPL